MKKKIKEFSVTPSQSTFKYGSENKPMDERVNRQFIPVPTISNLRLLEDILRVNFKRSDPAFGEGEIRNS